VKTDKHIVLGLWSEESKDGRLMIAIRPNQQQDYPEKTGFRCPSER
jgi:hypothetical protein